MDNNVMTAKLRKNEFRDIVGRYIMRDGIVELMDYLESSDFYTAPASTKYHGSEESGLVQHSINVFKHLMKLAELYAPAVYSEETLAVVALFHDLCKIDYYSVDYKNVKDDRGTWSKVPYYTVNEKWHFGAHGAKSVNIVRDYIHLSHDEITAINNHMGMSDIYCENPNAVSACYEDNLLAWLLHVADEAATYIDHC